MASIAIVDDDTDTLFLMRALLENQYSVSTYEDGQSALAGMLEAPPDLVLVDHLLPDMTGVELLRAMRREDRLERVRAISLTGLAMPDTRAQMAGAGFDDYIAKPIVEPSDLIALVERALAP